ncbi:ATP-dependent DNA helicase, partial [Micromonospora globispora]|uniref:HRDC domain-containing protein n=1 Tax=Micromonospora globispora TaxID=1450148 RepID=UPI000D9C0057
SQRSRAAPPVGWAPDAPPAGGAARERWEALAALVQLAEEYASTPEVLPIGQAAAVERPVTLGDFNEELARRAVQQHVPTVEGVTLASLHSAKGLEWDAVFLVGLSEGTLPTTYAKTPEQVEEERRLLYVGITRAREWLWLSYAVARSPGGRARRPSRFLPQLDRSGGTERAGAGTVRRTERRRTQVVSCRICGATLLAGADRKLGRCPTCPSDIDEELYERLRDWRQRVAGAQKIPAYVVFTDATLTALAERKPGRTEELVAIAGIGPRKLGLYGDTVLALVGGAAVDDVCPQKSFENSP